MAASRSASHRSGHSRATTHPTDNLSPLPRSAWQRAWLRIRVSKEKELFLENLSLLLASGMDVLVALDSMRRETRSSGMRRVLTAIHQDIESGTAFWIALDHTDVFSHYIISLIRVGEQSGRLAEHVQVVAQQVIKDRDFRSKVQSAMLYPALIFGLTIIVGLAVAWFILPRLATVFDQLQQQLPLITRILIAVGNWLGSNGWYAVPATILGLMLAGYVIFVNPRTRGAGERLVQALPGIGQLMREVELARTGYLLGHMLEAGVPIVEAFASLRSATSLRRYQKFYSHVEQLVADGHSFRSSFQSIPKAQAFIPAPIQQMIVAGEQSGRLSETLLTIGRQFETKTETTVKNLTVLLEPTLLVVVWLGVVLVAVSVIMPIYSLIGGLNSSPTQPTRPTTPSTTTNTNASFLPAETNTNTAPVEVPGYTDQTPPTETPQPPVIETPTESPTEPSSESPTGEPETPASADNPSEEPLTGQRIRIDSNRLGYLNVRSTPNLNGEILQRVIPGDIFLWTTLQDGWYEIVLNDAQTGWVSGKYVTDITNQ